EPYCQAQPVPRRACRPDGGDAHGPLRRVAGRVVGGVLHWRVLPVDVDAMGLPGAHGARGPHRLCGHQPKRRELLGALLRLARVLVPDSGVLLDVGRRHVAAAPQPRHRPARAVAAGGRPVCIGRAVPVRQPGQLLLVLRLGRRPDARGLVEELHRLAAVLPAHRRRVYRRRCGRPCARGAGITCAPRRTFAGLL
ncbi:MAG: Optional hypothetical component of the B12 transporter BtuM, partial [uncultured Lysobacter sp.]